MSSHNWTKNLFIIQPFLLFETLCHKPRFEASNTFICNKLDFINPLGMYHLSSLSQVLEYSCVVINQRAILFLHGLNPLLVFNQLDGFVNGKWFIRYIMFSCCHVVCLISFFSQKHLLSKTNWWLPKSYTTFLLNVTLGVNLHGLHGSINSWIIINRWINLIMSMILAHHGKDVIWWISWVSGVKWSKLL
jgi:hypothetical protein